VLVVAKVVVKIAAAKEELFANEQALDLVFSDFCGLGGGT
jgi:hypothetical protein